MANWSDLTFSALMTDYVSKLNTFLSRAQATATTVEAQTIFVTSALHYKGLHSALGGTYPSSPTLGDTWKISAVGTIGGVSFVIGDTITYNGSTWDKGSVADTGTFNALTVKGTSSTGLINIDSTTGATSDFSGINFARGGSSKWQIGNNEDGASLDNYGLYSFAVSKVIIGASTAGINVGGTITNSGPGGLTNTITSTNSYALLVIRSNNGSGTYGNLWLGASKTNDDLVTGCVAGDVIVGNQQNYSTLLIANSGVIGKVAPTGLLAGTDNTLTCGGASNRWSVVYAGTGSINTSDANEKLCRGELSDAEIRAWARVRWIIFQWNAAVAEKGETARHHAGTLAQDVATAFSSEGLDASRYGLWCADEAFEEFEVEETETVEIPVMETVDLPFERIEIRNGAPVMVRGSESIDRQRTIDMPVKDVAGNQVMREIKQIDDAGTLSILGYEPITYPMPVTEVITRLRKYIKRRSLGIRYGLRYDQCFVFEAAYSRARIAALESRVAAIDVLLAEPRP